MFETVLLRSKPLNTPNDSLFKCKIMTMGCWNDDDITW